MRAPPFPALALLLVGCGRVSVTPLGSTSDGRRQFELTCSPRAMSGGDCDARAREMCGGDYETQSLGSAPPSLISDGQGNYFATDDRVLLIACHAPARTAVR